MFHRISKIILFISILFSLIFLFGYSIQKYTIIDPIFSHPFCFFFWFLIFTLLFYLLLFFLFHSFQKLSYHPSKTKIGKFIFEQHPLLSFFLLFFFLGLPIVILYYPGPVQWDGMNELGYFFGITKWTNHHPVFPTVWMGLCVKMGRMLGNDNFGVFLFTFPQYLFSCFTFSYILSFLRKLRLPNGFLFLIFLFFGITPIWYVNGYTLIKDTYFYLFFALFCIQYFLYLTEGKNTLLLLMTALGVILFRNNGIYVIGGSFFFLLFWKKKHQKQVFCFLLFFILFQILYNVTLSFCGIEQGNIRETLSVPLQQTARYLKNYEITEEEKEILNQVFDVDLEVIVQRYNPELSDPVKDHFQVSNFKMLLDYFKVWKKQLLKHPKVYLDAYLENYYGYLYPFRKDVKDGVAWFKVVTSNRINTKFFHIHMSKQTKSIRHNMEDGIDQLRDIPLLGLFFNTGIYSFFLIGILGYALFQRKYSKLSYSIPILLAFAFCFLSPVNALLRYMNPVIVSLPILFGAIFSNKEIKP